MITDDFEISVLLKAMSDPKLVNKFPTILHGADTSVNESLHNIFCMHCDKRKYYKHHGIYYEMVRNNKIMTAYLPSGILGLQLERVPREKLPLHYKSACMEEESQVAESPDRPVVKIFRVARNRYGHDV